MAENQDQPDDGTGISASPTTDITAHPSPGATSAPSIDAVNGYYQKYLGRSAGSDDAMRWLSGNYGYGTDLPTIENAIRNSPEAQAYAKSQQGGTAGGFQWWNGRSSDPTQIGNWLTSIRGNAGINPSITNDPGYWIGRIQQTGGLGQDNADYWTGLAMRPEGAPEGGTTGLPGGSTGGPTTGFNDPAYQQLLKLAQSRIASLGLPVSFPSLQDYLDSLKANATAAKARAQTFADQLTARIGELQKPLLTDANVVNQRALASNNLQAQRDAALANKRQQRFASGFAPTSGLYAGDERSINDAYTNAQAQIDAKLQEAQIQGDEQRRNEATQLQELVQQAVQGGDVTSLQDQATQADLENQMFNLQQQREREQLATAQLPVDLTNMGFSNALNASNSGTNPLSAILSLLSLGNSQQGLQQLGQNSNWSWLGSLFS